MLPANSLTLVLAFFRVVDYGYMDTIIVVKSDYEVTTKKAKKRKLDSTPCHVVVVHVQWSG